MKVHTFLGKSSFTGSIENCTLALTTYADKPVYEEWHTHDKASISFLLDGNYEEELEGHHYKRTAGNVKFIAAGVVHRCQRYASGTRKINLELSQELLKLLEIKEEYLVRALPHSHHTRYTLVQLFRELSDDNDATNASAQQLLYSLLQHNSFQNTIHKTPPSWVAVLREFLHDQWDCQLTLQQMADETGVHPVTLSRYFPQYFSSTIGDYRRKIRVDKALQMLRATTLSLTQIAYACGFADQGHFTRTFKATTGFLPKDIRKL